MQVRLHNHVQYNTQLYVYYYCSCTIELPLYIRFRNKNYSAVSEVGVVYKCCTSIFSKKYSKQL